MIIISSYGILETPSNLPIAIKPLRMICLWFHSTTSMNLYSPLEVSNPVLCIFGIWECQSIT